MFGDSASSIATFAIFSALLLASVIGLLCRLQPWRLLLRLQASLRSARERAAAFHGASTDEVGLLVQVKMQQLKVDHVWYCILGLNVFSAPIVAGLLYNIARGTPQRDFTPAQDVLLMIFCGFQLLPVIFRRTVSWSTIDIFYGAIMSLAALFALPVWCRPEMAMYVAFTTTAVALVLNIVRRSMIVSAIFNSVLGAVLVGLVAVHGDKISSRSYQFAVLNVMVLIFFPTFAYVLDISIGMNIRNGLENQATKEVLSAASALLRTCCDVMVEVDVEGTIVSPARELGGFLLRDPGRCYTGSKLPTLFSSEEDRRKFLGKLREPEPSDEGMAEAINVRMKDGNDELLKVELMWFGFRHLNSQRHYMVGLREFCEFFPAGNKSSRRRRQLRGDGDGPAEGSVPEHPEHSASSENEDSRATSLSTTSMEVQVASITVDATVEGFPIQGYSPGFRSRIGRLQLGSDFMECVRHKEHFARWLQMALNLTNSGDGPPDFHASLNLPQGRLEAMCRLLLEEGESLALNRVQLIFFDIRQCRKHVRGPPDVDLRGTPVGRMTL